MCFGILGPGRQDPLDPIGPDKPNRRFVFTRDLGKQLQLLIYFIDNSLAFPDAFPTILPPL